LPQSKKEQYHSTSNWIANTSYIRFFQKETTPGPILMVGNPVTDMKKTI
jgi:hypothetical protein